jgi:hypothetical protein
LKAIPALLGPPKRQVPSFSPRELHVGDPADRFDNIEKPIGQA